MFPKKGNAKGIGLREGSIGASLETKDVRLRYAQMPQGLTTVMFFWKEPKKGGCFHDVRKCISLVSLKHDSFLQKLQR